MGVNPPAPHKPGVGQKKHPEGWEHQEHPAINLIYVTFLTCKRVSGYLNISELRPKCGCSQQNSSVKIRIDKTLIIQPTRQRSMSHIKIQKSSSQCNRMYPLVN